MKLTGVYSSRPNDQIFESPCFQSGQHRLRGDHGADGTTMVTPQIGVGPTGRQRSPCPNILWELSVIRGGKGQSKRTTPSPCCMADRPFGRDMDGLRAKLAHETSNAALWKRREPDGRIGGTGIGRKILRGDEPDFMPQLSQMLGSLTKRSNHSIDLRLPSIGRDADSHRKDRRDLLLPHTPACYSGTLIAPGQRVTVRAEDLLHILNLIPALASLARKQRIGTARKTTGWTLDRDHVRKLREGSKKELLYFSRRPFLHG